MGSLMAGWNSPAQGTKASYARTSSFTKEEIETYWKTKRDLEEEHLRAAAELALRINAQESCETVTENEHGETHFPGSVEEELEKLSSYKDWWTKSNWAFLNDPAMGRAEVANNKYVAQYHVADPDASRRKGVIHQN